MPGSSHRYRRALSPVGACALTAALAMGAASALAQPGAPVPQPNAGGVNAALAFPAFSAGTFLTPPAALRPKYRWWRRWPTPTMRRSSASWATSPPTSAGGWSRFGDERVLGERRVGASRLSVANCPTTSTDHQLVAAVLGLKVDKSPGTIRNVCYEACR